MDWLVNTLKPMIDADYRTFPDRENTFIAGSSMGGLMSLYAAGYYNEVSRGAACLSPSLWVAPQKVEALLREAPMAPDTCIYVDYGTEEMSNHPGSPELLRMAVQVLLQKQVRLTFRIVPGGTHSEASWEKQIPIFMQCLGL
jgi:predicted alpha/beta superfamily hydrolase